MASGRVALTRALHSLAATPLESADPRADDRLDDPALAQLGARDLVDDPAARHDDDAVAQSPRQLERVARLDDAPPRPRRALPRSAS